MTDRYVFEGVVSPKSEDSGMALIEYDAFSDGSDPALFVRLQSWDETRTHTAMKSLTGRLVRIVVEVVRDE